MLILKGNVSSWLEASKLPLVRFRTYIVLKPFTSQAVYLTLIIHYLIDLLRFNYFGTIDGICLGGFDNLEINHESTG